MRADECLAVGKNNLFCDSDLELGCPALCAAGGRRRKRDGCCGVYLCDLGGGALLLPSDVRWDGRGKKGICASKNVVRQEFKIVVPCILPLILRIFLGSVPIYSAVFSPPPWKKWAACRKRRSLPLFFLLLPRKMSSMPILNGRP